MLSGDEYYPGDVTSGPVNHACPNGHPASLGCGCGDVVDHHPGDDGVTPAELEEEMDAAYATEGAWGTTPIRLIIVGVDGRAWANAIQEVAIFDGALHLVAGEELDDPTDREIAWAFRATSDLR